MLHAVSRRQGLPMAAKQPMHLQTLGPIEGTTARAYTQSDQETCIGPQVLVSLE